MINLCAKFEVPSFNRYGKPKENAKCIKGMIWMVRGITQWVIGNVTLDRTASTYDFL